MSKFGCAMTKFFSKFSTFTTESPHIHFSWVKTKLKGSKGHISVQIYQKWPKRRLFGQKMTSYVENRVKYDKIFISTLSTFTTESFYIYFLRVKMKLTGSKGHTSVRIYQKWSKWRIFGHKMTSQVKIGVRYGKKIFSTLSTLTTESSHIYFLWVKTKLTGSKGHISVRIDQKWPKWRHFGHKMTSYVEIGVRYDKNFFFNIIYSYY